MLSLTVELVKKDGNKPRDASKVALGNAMNVFYLKCKVTKYFFTANNTVNALFQSSTVSLNGVAINPNPEYHYLRSSMYL